MRLKKALVLILVALMLTSCGANNKDIEQSILSMRITLKGDKCEVYKNKDKQQAIIVHNGKIERYKEIKVSKNERSIMELPDIKDLQPVDITTKEPYSKLVWDGTIEDGAKQLKFYQVLGYNIECIIEAQDYIDIYISKDNKYKRILILDGQLSIADVNKFEFKNIDEYIK